MPKRSQHPQALPAVQPTFVVQPTDPLSSLKTAPIKFSKRKKEVIKHSSAVQITNSITLLQRRAWNILLARAYDDMPSSDRYQMRVRDLVELLDYNSNDDAHLKEALEKLTTTAVRWNILRKDQSSEWGVFPLLAGAVIKQGVLTYAFSPFLKERLHNPRMYARISLSFQNKFQSKHALALYELCLDYFDFDRAYGETPYISVSQFRELMGVTDDEYQSFARLNEKVIKKAVIEINALSDLAVTVRFERKMRKIDSLKFCVNRRTEMVLPFASLETPEGVTEGKNNKQMTEQQILEQQMLKYDLLFGQLTKDQQVTLIADAFEALPPFVKTYTPGNQPNITDKTTEILLRHERNRILDEMMKKS
jgi:plasmid replication initiation protein